VSPVPQCDRALNCFNKCELKSIDLGCRLFPLSTLPLTPKLEPTRAGSAEVRGWNTLDCHRLGMLLKPRPAGQFPADESIEFPDDSLRIVVRITFVPVPDAQVICRNKWGPGSPNVAHSEIGDWPFLARRYRCGLPAASREPSMNSRFRQS
jgi:hypothetical protein